MTNSSEQYSPFEKLKWLAAKELAEHFPNYHNALLGGVFEYECEILALDALMDKKFPAFAFYRLDKEEQEKMIGGVEELLLEDLHPSIWGFYREKLDKGPKYGYSN